MNEGAEITIKLVLISLVEHYEALRECGMYVMASWHKEVILKDYKTLTGEVDTPFGVVLKRIESYKEELN